MKLGLTKKKVCHLLYFVWIAHSRGCFTEVVLIIPNAASEGAQRVSILQNKCFEDVLKAIHEVIGCQKVARKPMLSYKLSSATQKDDSMNISTQDDWEGCLEEVEAAEKKKKGVVTVKIIVSEQVTASYLYYCFPNTGIIVHEFSPRQREEETYY
jgi:hypothetical protein